MPEDPKNNNINLYLTDESKMQRVFGDSDPDPSKNYVILQLDKVQKRLLELERLNAELSKMTENSEEEQDRLDEKIRYMRGKLKNFVELRNMEKSISEKVTELNVLISDHNKDLENRFVKMVLFICSEWSLSVFEYFFLWCFGKLTVGNIALLNILNGVSIMAYGKMNPFEYIEFYGNFKLFAENRKIVLAGIETSKKEIKKTDEANDYISEFIDIM